MKKELSKQKEDLIIDNELITIQKEELSKQKELDKLILYNQQQSTTYAL